MFRKHHSTTIDDDDDETMQHTTSSTRKEENSESENNYVSETPSKQESSSRTDISSPLEATTSPLTPNSQNRILTKLPSSLKLDTQKLIRKSSLSSFSASLSKSLRSSMNPHNVSNDYSKQAQSSNQTMKSSTWSNFHSPQTIIIMEIGRKYFKCGVAREYAPRVISVVPSDLSEMLCSCKNQKFNSFHMKESFEQFIQKDLGINENQNEKNYLLPLNNVDMSMIIKDEIFDEYMAIFGENGRFQANLDDSEFEKKLSTLFSNYMNKLFIDEMKLVMDSIEGIIILENTHQLHQKLLRKLIENDICTVRKFPHLKSLKFMNSQGCAILPSFCSMNTFNFEKTTTQARTYDAKLSSPKFLIERFPIMQRTLGNATMGLHALPLAQHGNLEKVQHDLGVTGLVIDCGYSECRVVPVLFGSILSMCVEILPIGSKHVLRNLKELLCGDVASSTNIDNHQEHLMLEDVLSRLCFCSYPSADNNDSNSQTIMYKYSVGSVEIPVTHKTRTKSCEFIFEPLTRAIIECVKRLETEARGQVLRNVIVCGGLSELNGFKQRLIAVLNKHVLAQDFGSNKNWLKHMGINTFNPTRSSLLNWYGASIAFSHYSYAQSKTIKHDQ